jgi:hypothetical protein
MQGNPLVLATAKANRNKEVNALGSNGCFFCGCTMRMRLAATAASSAIATATVKGWCVRQQRLLFPRGAFGSNGCFFRVVR